MQQIRALTPYLVEHWVLGSRWWFDTGHHLQGGWVPLVVFYEAWENPED